MSELDDKLSSILNNPQMMQQIMSLAQSMGTPEAASPPPQAATAPAPPEPTIDPAMISKIAGLMQRSSIDPNQRQLLQALRPYLSGQKLRKLERAMHAAKMAGIASDVGGLRGLLGGR